MADQAFTTYAFPATGAPTSRTMPDRLAEIKNVRDFGATGNGVTDDLAAIMAAFNWTVSANRGTLYFPPGTYYVSAPIDISTVSSFVFFLGHMGASTIVGNFADYVIKRYLLGSNALSGGHTVEKLTIINRHASGGGIRMGVCVGASIRDCDITANIGVSTDNSDVFGPPGDPGAYWYSLEVSVTNCKFRPYDVLATNSIGLMRGANGHTTNCTFKDFDHALRLYGGQGCMPIQGCYFEHNNIGIAGGVGPDLEHNSSTAGISVLGCYFKNNGIAIHKGAGSSRYAGIRIEAAEGTIPGNPQYGLYLPSGTGGCSFAGILITGQYQQAGVYVQGGESSVPTSLFSGVVSVNTSTLGGVAWQKPASAFTVELEGCNVAPVFAINGLPAANRDITSATWSAGTATVVVTSHNLGTPGANITVSGVSRSGYNGTFQNATVVSFNTFTYPISDPGGSGSGGSVFWTGVSDIGRPNVVEGEWYNVSDADVSAWGAPTVAPFGFGSNHVKLRFTPAAWTVVGK